jgi:hypothetical protein
MADIRSRLKTLPAWSRRYIAWDYSTDEQNNPRVRHQHQPWGNPYKKNVEFTLQPWEPSELCLYLRFAHGAAAAKRLAMESNHLDYLQSIPSLFRSGIILITRSGLL